MNEPTTLPISTGSPRQEGPPLRPHLFLVLHADQPGRDSARFSLADVDEVSIGRGDALSVERESQSLGRKMTLRIPDPTMSGEHVRLIKALGRWMIQDAGSRNGTRVDGESVDRAALPDGALIETGHTLFRFRSSVPTRPEDAGDQLPSKHPPPLGLETLLPPFSAELAKLARVAASELPIALQGETGVGKEVLARVVHQLSGRKGEFVAVNCGALPEQLVENELFGHRKGSFTGAETEQMGLVRASDGGTLFLDEIGDLKFPSQAALLRVLQEREVRPVGGTRSIPVDLRVVVASHRELSALVDDGSFRQDLRARLMGFTLAVPPLRERREDLGILVRRILGKLVGADRQVGLTLEAARALCQYGWPLNIREVERALSAAVVLAGRGPIELEHLPAEVREFKAQASATANLAPEDAWLREELVKRMREHSGNISAVARSFGKARVQVQRWLKRFELDAEKFRS